MRSHQYPVDARLIHREVGFVALTASATIDTVQQRGQTRTEFVTVLRIEAIDVANGDEEYRFIIECSNDNFTTRETAAILSLGAGSARLGVGPNNVAGDEYEVYWCTEINKVQYKDWRIRAVLAGTTPSITFSMNSTC